MAPTLEEFGKILDSHKQKKGPYKGLGQILKPKELAEVLDIPVEDLTPNIKIWGKIVAAISVFWAVKVKNEDPVPALLVDVYHTLHLRFEKNGGLILCSYRSFTNGLSLMCSKILIRLRGWMDMSGLKSW
ncbi:hypothetical protein KIW84_021350 [Lathyrus oleraceus]|uniref:DUF7745 domain-containing protein n=1 Tax=Pisum sativum TaxID=3888 RepID=A0A9D4YBG4_PEA|nr:hypothetical protein KIW84_021350 [Pisum sativum]